MFANRFTAVIDACVLCSPLKRNLILSLAEAKSSDEFIADAINLSPSLAIDAIKRMRVRLDRPEKTPEILLLDMKKTGLTRSVDQLRDSVKLI